MTRKPSIGIDVWTYQVKIMVALDERPNGNSVTKIIGTGFGESKGLRHGYIINQTDVTKALKQAVAQAEKAAGLRVRNAYLSVGGIGLSSVTTTGTVAVSR